MCILTRLEGTAVPILECPADLKGSKKGTVELAFKTQWPTYTRKRTGRMTGEWGGPCIMYEERWLEFEARYTLLSDSLFSICRFHHLSLNPKPSWLIYFVIVRILSHTCRWVSNCWLNRRYCDMFAKLFRIIKSITVNLYNAHIILHQCLT